MTWLAYQHRRLILRLLLSQPRSALIRFLHRLLVRKPKQQGMEPALDAFKVAVLTPTEHQALAKWQAEHLYLSEVARTGVDTNSNSEECSFNDLLEPDMADAAVTPATHPGFFQKLEDYAATLPPEVAGYIRNIPAWFEQEEAKLKAKIAEYSAFLTAHGHAVTPIADSAPVAQTPVVVPVTQPPVATAVA